MEKNSSIRYTQKKRKTQLLDRPQLGYDTRLIRWLLCHFYFIMFAATIVLAGQQAARVAFEQSRAEMVGVELL